MAVNDFPGGTVDRNLPANAGDTGSVPGLGRLHMQRATKPVRHNSWACMLQLLKPSCLEPALHSKRSHRGEKPAHLKEEEPPLPASRESPRTATKTQSNEKEINKIIFKLYDCEGNEEIKTDN